MSAFMNIHSFQVSLKHWKDIHDMLFTSSNTVKLFLIRRFILAAPIQCEGLRTSRWDKAKAHMWGVARTVEKKKKSLLFYPSELFGCRTYWIGVPKFPEGEKTNKKKNLTSVGDWESRWLMLQTASFKRSRLWSAGRKHRRSGMRKRVLDSQRLCEG